MRDKIDLMIIGAQKAGTSSLNTYLAQHPNICTHFTQEFAMFADDQSYNRGLEYYFNNTVTAKAKKDTHKNTFVAKRAGLLYKPDMLQKLKQHNPDVKIAIVLRNPIDRAFSAFWYCRQTGMEPYDSFEDAVYINDLSRFRGNVKLQNNCDYIGRSSYSKHLYNVFSIFNRENIRVAVFEDIILDLNKYLNELTGFLNLNEEFNFNTKIKYNERGSAISSFLATKSAPGQNDLLKKFLPFKMRTFLKQTARKVNTKKLNAGNKILMKADTRAYLKNVFQKEIAEIEKLTMLSIFKFWPEFIN